MQRSTARVAAWALAVFAVVAALPAAWLTVLAVAKARLPYNEEGNHFDGLVVHHEGTAVAYGVIAVVLWLLAVGAGLGARRVFKRAQRALNENAQG
jgi:hypothetical protein